MKNVAGLPIEELDQTVERELTRVGVPVVRVDVADPAVECASHIRGVLGPFTFERAWVYWRVTGPMPLHIAEELYATPVGREDIRAGGHCGCPEPKTQADHYDADGNELRPSSEAAAWDDLAPRYFPHEKRPVFVDSPEAEAARSEVQSFHVDSELGLYLLVDAIGRHGLALPAKPSAGVSRSAPTNVTDTFPISAMRLRDQVDHVLFGGDSKGAAPQ